MIEGVVGEGDGGGHAAEVQREADARVGEACLGQVEDGAPRQELLDVRMARGQQRGLEVLDARFRHERGGRADLFAVTHHEYLRGSVT